MSPVQYGRIQLLTPEGQFYVVPQETVWAVRLPGGALPGEAHRAEECHGLQA